MELPEAVVPEAVVEGDPVADGGEAVGAEVVEALAALALLGDEAGVEEDAEVLGDGGSAHVEVGGEVVDGAVGVGEEAEHAAPGGMADGVEDVLLAVGGAGHGGNIRKRQLTSQVDSRSFVLGVWYD